MNYVIMSGPSMATAPSSKKYLSLVRDTDFSAVVTVVSDKSAKTNVGYMPVAVMDEDTAKAVLSFLQTFANFNGGQSVQFTKVNAFLLVRACQYLGKDSTIKDQYGLDLELVVRSEGNTARYEEPGIRTVDLMLNAEFVLTVSKA